ncbi:MAG TPA: hypothetical protein VFY06_15865 [Verrucomicrobiae bacterium]|nr:hypothetical protein [Verrucomicrobiae bacterium]
MNNAAAKILMMKLSIRCFVDGLLGLIPIIGFPFALVALWFSGRIRQLEKQSWNPAKPYHIGGLICGAVGAILWGGVLVIIIGQLVIHTWL